MNEHYENFPVASFLLPKNIRPAVMSIYHFARTADDIADEGILKDEERLLRLNTFDAVLTRINKGENYADCPLNEKEQSIFFNLEKAIKTHTLPVFAFQKLLRAFKGDIQKKRYATFKELENYAQFSAVPIGVLMLKLFHCATPKNLNDSQKICTALQLTNICQDVALDLQKNRIYLPQDEMKESGVTENDLFQQKLSPEFRALMAKQTRRAKKIMQEGAPMVFRLPFRFAWELRLTIQGALLILEKIEKNQWDIFQYRPKITREDVLPLLKRCFFQKNFKLTVEK